MTTPKEGKPPEIPHPEGLTQDQEGLIRGLYRLGAIRFEEKRWALHDQYSDAPLAPIYTDFRVVQRDLQVKHNALMAYSDLVKKAGKFDLLAGLPLGATALTSSLSDLIGVPMISPRVDNKTHGNVGRKVDGLLPEDAGKTALIVDDVLSLATTKLLGKSILEENGVKVTDLIGFMDYGIGGREIMAREGVRAHTGFTAAQMIDLLTRDGKVDREQGEYARERLQKLKEFLKGKA